MAATHLLEARDPDGSLSAAQWLAGGRASALFAVLAGVTLVWMSRTTSRAGLAVRALLVAAVGLALGELPSGLAVILTYYGLLFLLGLAFLSLRARTLAALAAVWVVAAPLVSHVVRPLLPERGFDSPTLGQVAEPGRLLGELTFTGYYPVVPWLAYLLVGMALARSDLRSRGVQIALTGGGLLLAALATALSRLLTRDRDPQQLEDIASGMFGTTPTGGELSWLLVVAPHSATPFDLAQTIGSALAVIGACLLVVGLLGTTGGRGVAVAFGAGTMTLSLYSLHVVMRTPQVWPDEDPSSYVVHVLVLLWLGAVYVGLGRRGPLERLVGAASRLVSRRR